MEQAIVPPAYNPHLKRVLKSFQDAAIKSLSGPSNYVSTWGDPSKLSPAELEEYRKAIMSGALKYQPVYKEKEAYVTPPTIPVQQVPFFLPMDSTRGEKSDTILEGETIACFIVGGEKRLCLPQILNTVLQDFTLQQINIVCDDLHIFCSRCSAQQLETLKMNGVLPWAAPSCGLITKTDAERLCNALLHKHPEKSVEPPSTNSFKVYHECFGKCKGIFNPDLYVTPYAKCIECCDCHGLFAPQKFVCHSHKALENRTCHWGFDSANWRSYLLLAKDQSPRDRLQDILEHMKSRFDYLNKFKRKQSSASDDSENKRAKVSDDKKSPTGSDSGSSWGEAGRENSAFRPWSPSVINAAKDGKLSTSSLQTVPSYLKTGPPVLLNPERVIPFSEKNSRFERNFAPNVSLDPSSQQKDGKCGADDDDDEIEEVNLSKVKVEDRVHVKAESPLEIDVSSDDTDTSSLFNNDSVPSTPREDSGVHLVSPEMESAAQEREQELVLLQRALAGGVGISVESRNAIVQEFLKLRSRQEERTAQLVQANQQLQKELERVRRSRKEKLRQFEESENNLRQEIEHLIKTNEENTKILTKECAQLRHESVARTQKQPDVLKMKAKYEYQIETLRCELENSEEAKKQLAVELARVRHEMENLQKQRATLANGKGSGTEGKSNSTHLVKAEKKIGAKSNGISQESHSHTDAT